METPTRFDAEVDASGLQCPMPLAKCAKALNALAPGQILKLIATDEGSVLDFQSWSKQSKTGELIAQETRTGEDGRVRYIHYLRRR
jgi:tRNA 2-thiouridine synthesizing protein A